MTEIKCKIFGLDDDEDTLEIIKGCFDEAGISDYMLFTKKKEFMEKFSGTTHVAIIDHYLGGTSVGYEIMKQIFEINKSIGTPIRCKVIVISGQQDPKMIAYYLNEGAFRYLDKNDRDFCKLLTNYVQTALLEASAFFEFWERQIDRVKDVYRLTSLGNDGYDHKIDF